MSIADIMKRVYHWLDHISRDYQIPVEKQMRFLAKQKEPKSDVERSFLQYRCQMFLIPRHKRVSFFLLSALVLWPYILLLVVKRGTTNCHERVDAVFVQNGMQMDIVPDELKERYPRISIEKMTGKASLDRTALIFLFRCLISHPFTPYYLLKIAMKIGLYCTFISEYDPKAIITYCETSFSSAIATNYCEKMCVEHINVQHGDFLKSIRFAGFRFTAFYVWDKHYKSMFEALGNCSTLFYISSPTLLTQADENDFVKSYFLTYYLGNESREVLKRINTILEKLEANGKHCNIRLHPRETIISEAKSVFTSIELQDPKQIGIFDSIMSCEYVCALCSTVLYQAKLCNCKIVIDDISDQASYLSLKEKEYIMLDSTHRLLSDIITADGN